MPRSRSTKLLTLHVQSWAQLGPTYQIRHCPPHTVASKTIVLFTCVAACQWTSMRSVSRLALTQLSQLLSSRLGARAQYHSGPAQAIQAAPELACTSAPIALSACRASAVRTTAHVNTCQRERTRARRELHLYAAAPLCCAHASAARPHPVALTRCPRRLQTTSAARTTGSGCGKACSQSPRATYASSHTSCATRSTSSCHSQRSRTSGGDPPSPSPWGSPARRASLAPTAAADPPLRTCGRFTQSLG